MPLVRKRRIAPAGEEEYLRFVSAAVCQYGTRPSGPDGAATATLSHSVRKATKAAPLRIISAALVAVILASGCGNDGASSGAAIGSDPGAAGVEEVTRAANLALFRADWPAVWSHLEPECQEAYGIGEIGVQMEVALRFMASLAKVSREDLKRVTLGDVEVFDLVEGESASIASSLILDGELFVEVDPDRGGEPYAYVDGRWYLANCNFEYID